MSSPLLIGAVTFLAVLALRFAGIVVGPVAVILGAGCLVFVPGPSRLSDRFIVFFSLGFGWLPLLGWIPGIGTNVDVPGILLAIGAGVASAHRVRVRRVRATSRSVPTTTEIVALAIGAVATLWWALPFSNLSLTGRLNFLFNGWDNSTHFSMFRSNIQLGSFVLLRRHAIGGGTRLGWDYPQGMHQAWAQFVRLWSPHPPTNPHWLLDAYSALLVLTAGVIIMLGCMNIARLCRRDLWVALPAMAILVQVYAFGRLWPFNGYPNFGLAVAATAVAATLLMRPTLSPTLTFFAVSGFALVAAYNWYPLLALAAPAAVVAAVRARNTTAAPWRSLSTLVIVGTVLVIGVPVAFFAHRGVSTLAIAGAVWTPGTPWALLVLCLAGLIGVVVARQSAHPDLATNVALASPAILGGIGLVFVAVVDISSSGTLSYYGQKFATGVFAVCLIVLASVLASYFVSSSLRRRLSKLTMAIVALLATVAALQVDGYVGPLAHATGATLATGFGFHQDLVVAPRRARDAEILLAAAQTARDDQARSGRTGGQWWFLETTHFLCSENAEWFSVLSEDPTTEEYLKTFKLVCGSAEDPTSGAKYVVAHFGSPTTGRIHLFVPKWLADAITREDPAWRTPGALLITQSLSRR